MQHPADHDRHREARNKAKVVNGCEVRDVDFGSGLASSAICLVSGLGPCFMNAVGTGRECEESVIGHYKAVVGGLFKAGSQGYPIIHII